MKKNYIICVACGYIMEESEHHEVCPACGVKAKAFQPYKSKVDEKREKLLGFHLHPIILHFPQAVVVFALMLLILLLFLSGDWKDYATICAKFNIFLSPLCVLGGFLSGLFDGKIRYKSVTTPILKKKIIFGILFFVLTLAAAIITLLCELTLGIHILLIVLMLVSTIIAVILGKMGSKLVTPVLAG